MELLVHVSFLFVYIAIPVAVIFLLVRINQLKKNSDLNIEQNKRVIQLLEKLNKQ